MKVLIINHFPIEGSGSGTYTRNIAVSLLKKGHEVGVVFPENTTEYDKIPGASMYPVYFTDKEEISGAIPFNFPCFTTHPRSIMTFYELTDEQLDMYIGAFKNTLKKAIAEFQPDLIHGQHIWVLSWLAAISGVPCVITAHGTDLMGYKKSERFRTYAEKAATGAKRIITISTDNNELVREIFPKSKDKAIFMQNGYDTDRFFPEPVSHEELEKMLGFAINEKLIFFAGKLARFKGIDVLIDAAKIYEKKNPGVITTIIAGAGELAADLKEQAEKNGLKDLRFVGHLDSTQLRRLYSSANVSVVPSRREPFGLVAIEALACGCPVVATNQGGLTDIINDQVGALVEVEDVHGLAEALQDEVFGTKREKRGKAAAEYALKNYAQDSLMDKLIEIYQS